MRHTHYSPGNHNVICDICGRKRKVAETALAYGSGDLPVVVSCIDGCADTRHPLNSPPPVIIDGRPVLNARPDTSSNNALMVNFVSDTQIWGSIFTNSNTWGDLGGNSVFDLTPIWQWGTIP